MVSSHALTHLSINPTGSEVIHPSLPSSQKGDTALIVASYNGHSSVVKELLQAGVTVNTTNDVSKSYGRSDL